MGKIFLSLLSICLIATLACGGGENEDRDAPESPPSKTTPGGRGSVEVEGRESDELAYVDEGKNNLPQVKSIKVVSVSDSDLRQGLRAVAEANDLDGDEVSFRYQWKKNEEDIVGAVDEVLEWQEGFKKGDSVSVEVIPFDGKDEGVWKSEGGFTIPNSPPKVTSEPEARMEGGKFSYDVEAEDPDGDPVEFALKNAPKGMTIEPATGVIAWGFDESDVGEYTVEIIASDSEGAKGVQTLTLTVPSGNP